MSKCKPVLDGDRITEIRVLKKSSPQPIAQGGPTTKEPDDSKPGTVPAQAPKTK